MGNMHGFLEPYFEFHVIRMALLVVNAFNKLILEL